MTQHFKATLLSLLQPAVDLLQDADDRHTNPEVYDLIEKHRRAHVPGPETQLEALIRKGRAYDRIQAQLSGFVDHATTALQEISMTEDGMDLDFNEGEMQGDGSGEVKSRRGW